MARGGEGGGGRHHQGAGVCGFDRLSLRAFAAGGSSSLSGRGDASRLNDGWQTLEFERVLFLPPEAEIRAGDRVEVARLGQTRRFTVVGEALRHATHQEVPLKFEAWTV